jgi:hypothetical protein
MSTVAADCPAIVDEDRERLPLTCPRQLEQIGGLDVDAAPAQHDRRERGLYDR